MKYLNNTKESRVMAREKSLRRNIAKKLLRLSENAIFDTQMKNWNSS